MSSTAGSREPPKLGGSALSPGSDSVKLVGFAAGTASGLTKLIVGRTCPARRPRSLARSVRHDQAPDAVLCASAAYSAPPDASTDPRSHPACTQARWTVCGGPWRSRAPVRCTRARLRLPSAGRCPTRFWSVPLASSTALIRLLAGLAAQLPTHVRSHRGAAARGGHWRSGSGETESQGPLCTSLHLCPTRRATVVPVCRGPARSTSTRPRNCDSGRADSLACSRWQERWQAGRCAPSSRPSSI